MTTTAEALAAAQARTTGAVLAVVAPNVPQQRQATPPALDFPTLRFRVQTLNGLMQHYAHLAECAALSGDAHTRDVNAGKFAAYQHAAHEISALLWPTDGVQ